MANKQVFRSRTAQWPLVQECVFDYNDGFAALSALNGTSLTGIPTSPVTDFGSKVRPGGLAPSIPYVANPNTGSSFFEIFALPYGAQILDGEMQIEVPYVGPATATLAVSSFSGLPLLAATSLKGAVATTATAGTHTGTAVSITVAAATGIQAGSVIVISGATGAGAGCYNGTRIVDGVNGTTVTFDCSAAEAAADTANTAMGGTATVTGITTGRVKFTIPSQLTGGGTVNPAEAGAGLDVRGTLAFTGGQAATQGRVRVRIMYTIDGRMSEVQTT